MTFTDRAHPPMRAPNAQDTRPPVGGELPGHRVVLGRDRPLRLDCDASLGPFTLAYQTYGRLNADKSNAILVCHALTGDQYVAEPHPLTAKPGWWDTLAGPGKVLDTDRYFLICANVLGGCMGPSGPTAINPATGKVIATAPLGGKTDVDRAVEAAQKALAGPYGRWSAAKRGRTLAKFADLAKRNVEELAHLRRPRLPV